MQTQAKTRFCKPARDWHARTNERERFVTVLGVHGPSSIDVQNVTAVGVEDPFNRGAEATEAWNIGLAVMHGRVKAAEAKAEKA
jgi:hypothetical protein